MYQDSDPSYGTDQDRIDASESATQVINDLNNALGDDMNRLTFSYDGEDISATDTITTYADDYSLGIDLGITMTVDKGSFNEKSYDFDDLINNSAKISEEIVGTPKEKSSGDESIKKVTSIIADKFSLTGSDYEKSDLDHDPVLNLPDIGAIMEENIDSFPKGYGMGYQMYEPGYRVGFEDELIFTRDNGHHLQIFLDYDY